MCSTLFSFAQLAAKQRSPQRETTTFASNDNAGATCILFPHDFFSLLDHKKLHAKKPFGSTIWTTKSCTRKHPSGARFGAQKVARENTLLEHDLGHKKLHAKRPIWSTIWSTKSCTRKDPFGARFGAQKVAKTWQETLSYSVKWFCVLCNFWGVSKKVGNLYNQFFNLSIVNCVEWPQWARWPGTVKKTLQTNHKAPE